MDTYSYVEAYMIEYEGYMYEDRMRCVRHMKQETWMGDNVCMNMSKPYVP